MSKMYSWLRKAPKSPHQVLAIINEANKAYEEYKEGLANKKDSYKKKFMDAGFVTGTQFKVKNSYKENLKNAVLTLIDIKNLFVKAKDEERDVIWTLKDYTPDELEKVK